MATVHVENVVHDYDAWRAVFDKFEAFRQEHGVRSYRVARSTAEPDRVMVDLELDTVADATAFAEALERIWRTPQSQAQLVTHRGPYVLDVVVERTLTSR